MVNEEKVRIMTAIARDELELGAKRLEEGVYYRSDYIRTHVFLAMRSFSMAYFLILILIALYNIDYILVNFVSLNYQLLLAFIIGGYIVLMLLCNVISHYRYSKRYQREQAVWKCYRNDLHRLTEYYKERKETGDDEITGA